MPKCSPPKSVEQLDPDLRPISLMSHLAKIVDGFTLSTLLNQVCDKLDVHRFALAGKSTTHALVYFLHALLHQSLDQAIRTFVYSLLISAKDSTWWTTTCWFEVQLLGVHEAIIRWIRSFNLTGRVQRVRPWRDPTRNEISSISFCDPSY